MDAPAAERHSKGCKCIVRLDRVCLECPCSGKNTKKQVPKELRDVIPYKKYNCGSEWMTYWAAVEEMENDPPEGCEWLVALEPLKCEGMGFFYF